MFYLRSENTFNLCASHVDSQFYLTQYSQGGASTRPKNSSNDYWVICVNNVRVMSDNKSWKYSRNELKKYSQGSTSYSESTEVLNIAYLFGCKLVWDLVIRAVCIFNQRTDKCGEICK